MSAQQAGFSGLRLGSMVLVSVVLLCLVSGQSLAHQWRATIVLAIATAWTLLCCTCRANWVTRALAQWLVAGGVPAGCASPPTRRFGTKSGAFVAARAGGVQCTCAAGCAAGSQRRHHQQPGRSDRRPAVPWRLAMWSNGEHNVAYRRCSACVAHSRCQRGGLERQASPGAGTSGSLAAGPCRGGAG